MNGIMQSLFIQSPVTLKTWNKVSQKGSVWKTNSELSDIKLITINN